MSVKPCEDDDHGHCLHRETLPDLLPCPAEGMIEGGSCPLKITFAGVLGWVHRKGERLAKEHSKKGNG